MVVEQIEGDIRERIDYMAKKNKKLGKYLDLKKGGKIKCKDGTILKLKPHSEREYLAYWKGNGACMEVLAYSKKWKGHHKSDRIHLIIQDGAGKRRGWLMNIEDAEHIIEGLVVAMRLTGNRGVSRR
jgi:hypothetical protein